MTGPGIISTDFHTRRRHQRGVAMIVALLMVATLSFIALGLTQSMTRSVRRAAASAAYSNVYWQAISARTAGEIALRAVLDGAQRDGGKLTPSHPLFLAPVDLPLATGTARVQFADATRCFNINSLVVGPGDDADDADDASGNGENVGKRNAAAVREFTLLATSIGLSEARAQRIANVIADWLDSDAEQGFGGAEDGFYLGLPSPFRTGTGQIADISELRAMDGMSQQIYRGLKPYLCAHPVSLPSKVNINMLRPQDAPVLSALLGGQLGVQEAVSLIEARPPEGWDSIAAFWAAPSLEAVDYDEATRAQRTSITSGYIEIAATISDREVDLEQRLVYEIGATSDRARLVKRTFGGDE